ncbi:MAG: GNAT family N-acetyltransferase [Planctomycetes bacterium]|nr:GNAT family N-acetyltransferase [Planctomycetota bacterium]
MDVRFRLLAEEDIPFGLTLRELAGWNQTEADWRAYLTYEPTGCFIAEADGRPAGTVTTIDYEGRVGWIGMLLVHPDLRGRGIGTALLERAAGHLSDRRVPSIKLDATPAGRAVYLRRGFADEYDLERRQGIARASSTAAGAAAIEPFDEWRDLRGILVLDLEAFGVRRGRVLLRIALENPGRAFVARDREGALEGYVLVRPGSRAFHIGPLVARTPRAAAALLARALGTVEGEPVFLDVPLANAEADALARANGLASQRPLIRMVRGSNEWPGNPELVYAISGPEKG